jgi:hypothetical protein
MATTTKVTTTSFDFSIYNAVMKSAGAGLKLFLVEQLLEDINKTCVYYKNPLEGEVADLLLETSQLRATWKLNAEKRERISDVAKKVDESLAGIAPQQQGDLPLATA